MILTTFGNPALHCERAKLRTDNISLCEQICEKKKKINCQKSDIVTIVRFFTIYFLLIECGKLNKVPFLDFNIVYNKKNLCCVLKNKFYSLIKQFFKFYKRVNNYFS